MTKNDQPATDAAAAGGKAGKPDGLKLMLRWGLLSAGCLGLAVGASCGVDEWQRYRQRLWIAAVPTQSKSPLALDGPPSPESFSPQKLMEPLPPITEFPVKSADEAAEEIDEAELVLGVELNGEARAYPINMLNGPTREILNDTLGGRSIAATW